MKDTIIDSKLLEIEEDYKVCLRIIGKYFNYLDDCGLKDFNKFSQYKWSYDRDKTNGYSYICIRYGSSLFKKSLIKRRAYIETEDLYKWVQNKELIQEAIEEAYQYIVTKINTVKLKLEELKATAVEYEEKLDALSDEYEEAAHASKRLVWDDEDLPAKNISENKK